jgi:hypothetical protein
MGYVAPTTRTTGEVITAAIWNQDVKDNMIAMTPHGASIVINEGGGVLTTGVKLYVIVPTKCTLTSASLLGNLSGSMSVDIWKCSYSDFDGGVTHPVDADTICGATNLALSSSTKDTDASLDDWTVDFAAGDILAVNVDSCTAVTLATLGLNVAYS